MFGTGENYGISRRVKRARSFKFPPDYEERNGILRILSEDPKGTDDECTQLGDTLHNNYKWTGGGEEGAKHAVGFGIRDAGGGGGAFTGGR